ncbi:uncharacterized protein TNCV_2773101 [Trichonephila clavipes]|nr:uncharacterized protein TNCV_2773101 [Trichonephila clavipes]
MSHCSATRGLLATDHIILNHGQVAWTTPELAPSLLTTTPHQREDVSALDRSNVHRCPTRRVFSGNGLELTHDKASHGPIPIPLGYRGQLRRELNQNLSGSIAHEGQGLLRLCQFSLPWTLRCNQIFRSGCQSDTKPPMFGSQVNLVLIYRPTEDMNG